MSALFYHYAACSTCKKAKKWLQDHKITFQDLAIVETPPSLQELKKYWKDSGLELKKFFNTSGQSYRALGLSEKMDSLSEEQCLKLLSQDGKLIKRPLLVKGSLVLVGFKEDEYKKLLKK